MIGPLALMLDLLENPSMARCSVIGWSAPIPVFGHLGKSTVASVGLNPSNREYVDSEGDELEGNRRRFHTLNSLGLKSWGEVDARHIRKIASACESYFEGNPYDTWFRKLDNLVCGTGASYYNHQNRACHLDLIPFATSEKWTKLTHAQRKALLVIGSELLAQLVSNSPIRVLILNGHAVVRQFCTVNQIDLTKAQMHTWSLPRRHGEDVTGIAYRGVIKRIGGFPLQEELLVLGYNHNIQSSFGVTTQVVESMRAWVSEESTEFFH